VPILRRARTGAHSGSRIEHCVTRLREFPMNAMDIVGLLLLVFLIAPLVTARPSRY
jgi:hypothetical protein